MADTVVPATAADTVRPGPLAPDSAAVAGPDSVPPEDPLPAPGALPADTVAVLDDFFERYTDLGMIFQGRMEMGGEWSRFRPCEGDVRTSCDPSLLPQLRPDLQFSLGLAGTISERVHVDVDYDETREFSATNDVNLYYEGRPGELLQRVEVGDVSFDLPRSRFLTQGIPAGNFGFRADAGAGPLSLQAVWAEQTGDVATRSLRLSDVGGEQAFVQDDTLVLDDADYVRGQFFFLLDPGELAGYPHVDALGLTPSDAPAAAVPGTETIQVYRFEADPVTRQQVEGYIQADAVAEADGQVVRESGWFRYLEPGIDYVVHSSGLWIAVRRPLQPEEMLAVSYVTAAGDTVGTYNPERVHNAGGRPELRLLKASGTSHRPGLPTWEREMHQVYRVSSSDDVEPESVQLEISLGERSGGRTFERGPGGRDVTYLRLFGLDEQAPADALDRTGLYDPAEEYLLDRPPISGLFLIFPTLEPFRSPPPVPSEGLSAAEAADLLGADANARIYEHPADFERRNSGLFRLNLVYRVRSRGTLSTFSLGALGVRDGSERIYLGQRLLQRGVDYRIDYDVGQVVLLDPETLLAGRPDAEIRATWEQKEVFRLAPTSVVGVKGSWDLGRRGSVDFLGLRQGEESLVNRPTLGVEPAANSVGGVSTELNLGAGWLDRALARIPGLRPGDSSSVALRGEVALSLPDPNTRGAVFLDDFDGSAERSVSVRSEEWFLGSAPGSRTGAEDVLPAGLDETRAAELVWQHTWIQETARGDSVGVFEGFFPRQDIDRRINVAGSARREPGLLLTFGRGATATPGDAPETFETPRWRSITSLLSPGGMDLTRSEFLELYVAQGDSLALVVDVGRVSEDALFVDDEGRVNGVVEETGEPWGLGLLDAEADPRQGEIWSDAADRRGVWDEECLAERGRVYRVGDRRANCTRGNGRRDTEDLDENGRLDTDGRYLRYVLRLDGSSPFLARTREETGTAFRLFRIPLRTSAGTPVGGFSADVDLRSVEHLRITVAGERSGSLILSRMRIVGSRWTKRTLDGVLRGVAGEDPAPGGAVEVGPVSRISAGAAYSSPPGVVEELDDPSAAIVGEGIEFQERALSLEYEAVGPGERAEVYHRYAQRPRDFLTYRRARLWAAARRGDWGPERPVRFFVKVGGDPENFYLYRTPLTPAADPGAVQPDDWLPEIEIDMERWMTLRRRAELELIENPPPPGGPPLEVWSADSTYAVVLSGRGRAPNLAAVRELSLGVWNGSDAPVSGEVWVNDFRLSAGVDEPGAVGFAEMDVQAGDVLSARVSYADRGAFFRQLETGPTYQDDRDLRISSTLALERFAPAAWGLRAPVRVSHVRSRRSPFFLGGSDVRAAELFRLREPRERDTRVSFSLSRPVPEAERDSWLESVAAGLEAGVGYTRRSGATVTSEHGSRSFDARLGYAGAPEARRIGLVPGFLEGVVEALLPESLERRLLESRLRWSPERIVLGTSYVHRTARAFRFQQIVRLPSDTAVRAIRSPRESLEATARVELQPFESLGADLDLLSARDLLPPEEATGVDAVHPLLRRERARLGGLDLGWETNRTLRTRVEWRPELASWLGTEVGATHFYGSLRDPNMVERRLEDGDTLRALRRNVSGRRDLRAALTVEPDSLLGGLRALERLSFEWEDGITTRFNRQVVDPDAGLRWGWGGASGFRVQDGEPASLVVDRRAMRAGGGLELPLDLTVDLRYASDDSRSLDLRSDRRLERVTWPDLSARIGSLPLPEAVEPLLTRVSLGSGFREVEQRITYGPASDQLRAESVVAVPLDVSVTWLGGIRTRYRGRFEDGEGRDPTGRTLSDRVLHGVTVSARFQPPAGWAERLERPIQLSVGWQYSSDRNCRESRGRAECVAFVDQRNRSVNLTLDSRVQRLELGFQMSWVDRQSFVGRHQGTTQFQLGLFGQFQLTAGDLTAL